MLHDILVLPILECLPLRDLRRAAAVSRLFYAEAWRAGLYIHRTISCGCREMNGDSLRVYNEILAYALRKDIRLGITLRWVHVHVERLTPAQPTEPGPPLDALRAVVQSLPVLVVLRVDLPSRCLQDVCRALQLPAPRLRFFEVSTADCAPFAAIAPSMRLFADHAPRLGHVRACRTILGSAPIRAFAHVERFDAVYTKSRPRAAPLLQVLPKLSDICVEFGTGDHISLDIDLAGFTPKMLVVKNHSQSTVVPKLRLADVPVLKHSAVNTSCFEWDDPPGWRHDCDELHITISSYASDHTDYRGGIAVSVFPPYHLWERVYIFEKAVLGDPLSLSKLRGVPHGLRSLRLPSQTLPAFLQCSAEFRILTHLRIDVATHDSKPIRLCCARKGGHRARMRCPALEHLSIYVYHAPNDAAPRVYLQDLGRLRRALGLAAKPALELHGASLEEAAPASARAPFTLQATFSTQMVPDVVVLHVLQLLPLRDLRRAAAASRIFYAEAWRAGLYIVARTQATRSGRTYNELLEHALRKELRLGLTLRWELANGLTLPPAQEPDPPLVPLRAVSESLPLLVILRVVLPSRCLEHI
ncbi:hypothetical protein AURDEDRAFT_172891 [Auricularia subglabra TFB-10046 SS5]|nr:hypothetical protein AURDEDRAFT_172891 [Auricularia subglabra TFB-10046 SS5]